MNQQIGTGSLRFAETPFIIGSASVVGTKEGEGPLAEEFDCIGETDKFGQSTWEAAESSLQKEALTLALGKSGKNSLYGRNRPLSGRCLSGNGTACSAAGAPSAGS